MPTVAPQRPETIRAGFKGFEAFCELLDQPLEPYMRRIARAFFSKSREIVAVLPRGNAKTHLAALLSLHHLITVEGANVVVGAASVQQARICFERMEGFLAHPELEDKVVLRHLELRYHGEEGKRTLRVIPSDGPRTHGLSCTLYVGDELWAWSERAQLLTAMQTGLVKRSDSKLFLISTSSGDLDSPLGRLRKRAMAQANVKRAGPVVESKGDLHWLEWSLGEQHELDNLRAVARCNPAPWIGVGDLRRQRESVPEGAFAQFHACRWGAGESSWLPAQAWADCAGETEFVDGEPIWVACDVGGNRSATAVVWLNKRLHVGSAIFQGEDGVFGAEATIAELAERYQVRELVYDPIRAVVLVRRLEERGVRCTVFQQTDVRMCPASSELRQAIIEGKLTHDGNEELARHIATAVAKQGRRGWRLDKQREDDQIDAAISLLMCYESATVPEPPPSRMYLI